MSSRWYPMQKSSHVYLNFSIRCQKRTTQIKATTRGALVNYAALSALWYSGDDDDDDDDDDDGDGDDDDDDDDDDDGGGGDDGGDGDDDKVVAADRAQPQTQLTNRLHNKTCHLRTSVPVE